MTRKEDSTPVGGKFGKNVANSSAGGNAAGLPLSGDPGVASHVNPAHTQVEAGDDFPKGTTPVVKDFNPANLASTGTGTEPLPVTQGNPDQVPKYPRVEKLEEKPAPGTPVPGGQVI